MKQHPQTPKEINKRVGKKPLTYIIVGLLVLAAVSYLIYQNFEQRQQAELSCAATSKKIDGLIIQKEYKFATKEIATNPKGCNLKNLKTQKAAIASGLKNEKKVTPIIEQGDLTVEAYRAGDIEQAKMAAARTIFLAQALSIEDQQKLSPERVKQLNSSLRDMFAIQQGTFNPNIKRSAPGGDEE